MIRPMVDDLMVQQQLKAPYKRWKHMVGVMCLNLTYRKHVKIITTTDAEATWNVGGEIKAY